MCRLGLSHCEIEMAEKREHQAVGRRRAVLVIVVGGQFAVEVGGNVGEKSSTAIAETRKLSARSESGVWQKLWRPTVL